MKIIDLLKKLIVSIIVILVGFAILSKFKVKKYRYGNAKHGITITEIWYGDKKISSY